MKSVLFTALIIFSAWFANAQTTKWTFDNSHTNINFIATHMVISKVTGSFGSYSGTVLSDKEDFTDAKINFNANVASISTNNEKRDTHLKSDDFFNAAKFPELSFKGKSLAKVSGNNYKLTGDLTIRDVTKPVELDVVFGGIVKDPWGNTRAGFQITGTINRFDYNLKWDNAIETGGLVVGKDIKIDCAVELIKQ